MQQLTDELRQQIPALCPQEEKSLFETSLVQILFRISNVL